LRLEVRQRIEAEELMAPRRRREFRDRAVSNAQIQLDGNLRKAA
jgi:hypothetical protein